MTAGVDHGTVAPPTVTQPEMVSVDPDALVGFMAQRFANELAALHRDVSMYLLEIQELRSRLGQRTAERDNAMLEAERLVSEVAQLRGEVEQITAQVDREKTEPEA